jgi:quercetin dioxygenase-like cupin family protein
MASARQCIWLKEPHVKKASLLSRKLAEIFFCLVPFVILFVAVVAPISAQAPQHGVVTPLSSAKLTSDGAPACLSSAVENGDPDKGASTFLLQAAPGCVVPPHYHTAEEQLLVVRGDVLTGMDGMSDIILGPAGFAMMPGKVMHWFTCKSKKPCLMFVAFDRTYDIVWAKPPK